METRPLGYLAKSIVEMSPIRIHLVDDGFSKARLQIHHQSFEEQAAAFSKGGWYGWCRQGKAVQIPFPLRRSWVVAMPCSFDNIGILGVWCLFAWVFVEMLKVAEALSARRARMRQLQPMLRERRDGWGMWREMRSPLMLHWLASINLWPGDRKVACTLQQLSPKTAKTLSICIYIYARCNFLCFFSLFFGGIHLLNICYCHTPCIRPRVCCRLFQLMTS